MSVFSEFDGIIWKKDRLKSGSLRSEICLLSPCVFVFFFSILELNLGSSLIL